MGKLHENQSCDYGGDFIVHDCQDFMLIYPFLLLWEISELEEAVRQKRPNDVVAEPLSVVVVSGLNVGDDLGNLSGENMIWVQCSLVGT